MTLNPKVIETLLETIRILRSPDGCAWDRKQTLDSLAPLFLEESYELLEAMQTKRTQDLKEECGDILLHVVFIAQLAEEKQLFNFYDVVTNLVEKMKRRHPHVFGVLKTQDIDTIKKNWNKIKEEKENKDPFSGIPQALPALKKAQKIQEKASSYGFDWRKKTGPFQKIDEELKEVKAALSCNDQEKLAEELGDLCFSVVNLTRKLGFDAETVCQAANTKLLRRFQASISLANQRGLNLHNLSEEELWDIWETIKKTT